MVDIDSNRIVDLLDSRDMKDVANWLKTYPNIKIVSRDGSNIYANAIKEAHPNAIQISDRFHLIKNLTDYCKRHITKILNFKIQIENSICNKASSKELKSNSKIIDRISLVKKLHSEGLTNCKISKTIKMDIRTVKKYLSLDITEVNLNDKDLPQIKHESSVSKKEKYINEVRSLHDSGYAIRKISKITGLARATVKKYLNPDLTPINGLYGTTKKSLLSPFHQVYR